MLKDLPLSEAKLLQRRGCFSHRRVDIAYVNASPDGVSYSYGELMSARRVENHFGSAQVQRKGACRNDRQSRERGVDLIFKFAVSPCFEIHSHPGRTAIPAQPSQASPHCSSGFLSHSSNRGGYVNATSGSEQRSEERRVGKECR